MVKPKSSVWAHFELEGDSNAKCLINGCPSSKVGSQKAYNLKSHLSVYHKTEYAAVQAEDEKSKTKTTHAIPAKQQILKFTPKKMSLTE